MGKLTAAWRRWECWTARLDNVPGRIVVTAAGAALWWRWPWAWKLLVPAYMLLLGRFAFGAISRAVLSVVYVLLMTPVGLVVRLSDPLRIRRRQAETYWVPRAPVDETLETARRQG